MTEFIECDTCRAKTGSPVLCGGCLGNRKTISDLQEKYLKAVDMLKDAKGKNHIAYVILEELGEI
jgi:hypothetical protein